jgi:hypothetical protein
VGYRAARVEMFMTEGNAAPLFGHVEDRGALRRRISTWKIGLTNLPRGEPRRARRECS